MKKKYSILVINLLVFFCGSAPIPAYYSSIDFSKSGSALMSQLANLITLTHKTVLPYTSSTQRDTWDALKTSDINPEKTTNVLLIYGWNDKDVIVNNDRTRNKDSSCHYTSCPGLWDREHVFARSLGTPDLGFVDAGSDVHNLRAIDEARNGSRSNRKYEFANNSTDSSYITASKNWYPGNEWCGDVARIIMYMYLRYPTQCSPKSVGAGIITYSALGDIPDVFLKWNAMDTVSILELSRNNTFQSFQGNRNPFIDNPYLATIIWKGPMAADRWNLSKIIAGYDEQSESLIEDEIILYPTVTSDYVFLINPNSSKYFYSIYNSNGQLIQSDYAVDKIDVSNVVKGLYIIKTNFNNKVKAFKIIKN